jgi:hypothetical protein
MSEDNRKEQEKKDELTEKDLDKASGGAPKITEGVDREANVKRYEGDRKR